MILKKLARVRVFPEGHPRRWEVTLKVWKLTSDEVHEGLTPETSASNSQRWPVELIIPNYLEIHSHRRSTTVSTETTPLFRWYIYYIPLVSWNLIGQLCVTRQRESLPDCGTIYFYVHDVSLGSLLCTRTCNAFTVFITELRALNRRKSD